MLQCMAMDQIDQRAKGGDQDPVASNKEVEEEESMDMATNEAGVRTDFDGGNARVTDGATEDKSAGPMGSVCGPAVHGQSDAVISEACSRMRGERLEDMRRDIEELERWLGEDLSGRIKAV